MKRQDIFNLIDDKRDSQDAIWTDRTQYKKSAPHIMVLRVQMRKLEESWYTSNKADLMDRFVNIAAIAVRALEEIDAE